MKAPGLRFAVEGVLLAALGRYSAAKQSPTLACLSHHVHALLSLVKLQVYTANTTVAPLHGVRRQQ
jgi:hypothetical protein